jgi:hypothetical protein
MLFYHEEQKLGVVKRITPPEDSGTVTVKLEPVSTLRGRLLYEDGSPITGGSLKATPEPQRDFSKDLPDRIITDDDGRFEMTLYLGAPYTVNLNAAGVGSIGHATIARELEVRPGGTKDLGDLYYMPKDGRFQRRSKAETPNG